ncbi:GNAT family N-acetyltransferase [Isoptericola cucumis]|uniref:GNAT family N-acetyltransferase n=1 Tax=Isoptericola cucumis TaxID=1776856 RepID=UPI001663734A|nr:GNAT family N-acetyltransferase [Isoptericola cucumis]
MTSTNSRPHPSRPAAPGDPLPVVRPAVAADRALLDRLWQLFRHDLSDVDGTLPDAAGRFRDERLHAAFTDPGWRGHVVERGRRPAGFALVRGLDGPVRVLSAFFVARGARREGVGRHLAARVLASTPGTWEVPFQDANLPAAAFWRRVAEEAAPGAWALEHRPVPGRPDLPPDAWIVLDVA